MKYELKELSFGKTIGQSLNLYFSNLIKFIVIGLVFIFSFIFLAICVFLITYFFSDPKKFDLSGSFLYEGSVFFVILFYAFFFLLYLGVSGLFVEIISGEYTNRGLKFSEYRQIVFKNIFPLVKLGISLLVSIFLCLFLFSLILLPLSLAGRSIMQMENDPGSLLAAFMLSLLFLLLIAALLCGFSIALPILILEKQGALAALKRSWSLTRKNKLRIFFLFLVLNFIKYTGIAVAATPIMILFSIFQFKVLQLMIPPLFLILLAGVAMPSLDMCLTVLIYYNMRIKKEGFEIEHLADQFVLPENEGTTS